MINSGDVEAAADVALVIQNGVAMSRGWHKKTETTTAPVIAITGQDLIIAMAMLALAVIAAAVIVRTGLTA